jgi:hypothetical protein
VTSFATQQTFSTPSAPVSIAVADLDADGRPDVAVATHAGFASVLRNTTAIGSNSLSFDTRADFAAGNTPAALVLTDADGDGAPDLAVANSAGNSVSVLLNARYRVQLATLFAIGTLSHDRIFADGFDKP